MNYDTCFQTPFFHVEKSTEEFEGRPYYRIVNGNGVILCVLDHLDRFVLVNQFRPNLGYVTREFPAGGIDNGETPLEAAHRELIEETGLVASFIALGTFRLQMNRMVHQEHLFFGLESQSHDKVPAPEILITERVLRSVFFSDAKYRTGFEHLAALGLLQKASIDLGVDIRTATYSAIHTAFLRRKSHLEAQDTSPQNSEMGDL